MQLLPFWVWIARPDEVLVMADADTFPTWQTFDAGDLVAFKEPLRTKVLAPQQDVNKLGRYLTAAP